MGKDTQLMMAKASSEEGSATTRALPGGTGKVFPANRLPKDPNELINNGWEDITPEGTAKNTNSREFVDPETGMKVRFDPGKPGAHGFKGKDHYHVYKPNSTSKMDYYLDVNGNPVPKGS